MVNVRKITICLLAGIMSVALVTACGKKDTVSESSQSGGTSVETTVETTTVNDSEETSESETLCSISFPYEIDDGKLMVNSVFQSDVCNPDAEGVMGEDVVTVELQNNSKETLVDCNLVVVLTDGTEIPFHVSYLPTGERIWAFATDNASSKSVYCSDVIVEKSSYEPETKLLEDDWGISADGAAVSISNNSDSDARNITVECHDSLDGVLFGGIVYEYTLDEIKTGAMGQFDAVDCFMGEVKVVNISAE